MKIAISVEDFNPNTGYLEYYLARELARMGHKVSVLTFREGSNPRTEQLPEGFLVRRYPFIWKSHGIHLTHPLGIIRTIVDFIRLRPDVVHCQPIFSPLSLSALVAQRFIRFRLVGSVISGLYSLKDPKARILFNLQKSLVRFQARFYNSIFVKTPELSSFLSNQFAIDPRVMKIIPLGADPRTSYFDLDARNEVREELGISADDLLIIYTGKIVPEKGLDTLIRAISPIVHENPKVKVLILGRGEFEYVETLKRLAETAGASSNLLLHPWVHRSLLSRYYSASDIAVWPGSPSISVVEAASVGLPLVVTNNPFESYVLGNQNGFSFTIGNHVELSRILKDLIADSVLREQMGTRSRNLVESRLNWPKIAEQYQRAYSQKGRA